MSLRKWGGLRTWGDSNTFTVNYTLPYLNANMFLDKVDEGVIIPPVPDSQLECMYVVPSINSAMFMVEYQAMFKVVLNTKNKQLTSNVNK